MDFQLYQSNLKFRRCGTIPQDVNLNQQKRHHFEQLCSRFCEPKLILIIKKTGLKVLHSKNAKSIIPKSHRDRKPIKKVKLEPLVKQS